MQHETHIKKNQKTSVTNPIRIKLPTPATKQNKCTSRLLQTILRHQTVTPPHNGQKPLTVILCLNGNSWQSWATFLFYLFCFDESPLPQFHFLQLEFLHLEESWAIWHFKFVIQLRGKKDVHNLLCTPTPSIFLILSPSSFQCESLPSTVWERHGTCETNQTLHEQNSQTLANDRIKQREACTLLVFLRDRTKAVHFENFAPREESSKSRNSSRMTCDFWWRVGSAFLWTTCDVEGKLVSVLSQVNHKGLRQGWTQTLHYLQVILFTNHHTTSLFFFNLFIFHGHSTRGKLVS